LKEGGGVVKSAYSAKEDNVLHNYKKKFMQGQATMVFATFPDYPCMISVQSQFTTGSRRSTNNIYHLS